jgi:hypothetical protein
VIGVEDEIDWKIPLRETSVDRDKYLSRTIWQCLSLEAEVETQKGGLKM